MNIRDKGPDIDLIQESSISFFNISQKGSFFDFSLKHSVCIINIGCESPVVDVSLEFSICILKFGYDGSNSGVDVFAVWQDINLSLNLVHKILQRAV